MNNVKANILKRLRANNLSGESDVQGKLVEYNWNKQQKIDQLIKSMQAVRTEIHHLATERWLDWLKQALSDRGFEHILVGNNETGDRIIQSLGPGQKVTRYDRKIEKWKSELFQTVDVGITSTVGAIAETGSLIIWPDTAEPRLMSLVPPVHIALLNADEIHDTFSDAIEALNWADNTPGNGLLISGPSKTSDIEQTLAFGIHGPRQLIVLIIDEDI